MAEREGAVAATVERTSLTPIVERTSLTATTEASLIARLASRPAPAGALDYDDDVAIIAPAAHGEGAFVASTDMLVEDVDFRLRTFAATDVGHKALAVNLSDLAAAGAEPTGYLQALALPKTLDPAWLDGYARGASALAAPLGLPLLGGDLSATHGPLTVCITVFGRATRVLRRRTARVGDALLVSGALGGAHAGFLALERGLDRPLLVERQRRPTPRLALGRFLAAAPEVRGAMDLSDGLGSDLPRFLPRGLGALLEAAMLPIDDDTRAFAAELSAEPRDWALSGGEDFELLCACAASDAAALCARAAVAGHTLCRIGVVTDDARCLVRGADGATTPLDAGFDHFA